MMVEGGGMIWKMEICPSREEQASRDLSSCANLTLVTAEEILFRYYSSFHVNDDSDEDYRGDYHFRSHYHLNNDCYIQLL